MPNNDNGNKTTAEPERQQNQNGSSTQQWQREKALAMVNNPRQYRDQAIPAQVRGHPCPAVISCSPGQGILLFTPFLPSLWAWWYMWRHCISLIPEPEDLFIHDILLYQNNGDYRRSNVVHRDGMASTNQTKAEKYWSHVLVNLYFIIVNQFMHTEVS